MCRKEKESLIGNSSVTTSSSSSSSMLSSSSLNDSSSNATNTTKVSLSHRICRFWYTLADSIEGKNSTTTSFMISIRMTCASAFFLGLIRYVTERLLLEHYFHWPENALVTKNAAASCASIVHSMHLVPGLIACFITNPQSYNPSAPLLFVQNNNDHNNSHSRQWNTTVNALLQFCTGYMLYDGILNILWLKTRMVGSISAEDTMFLGHHLATILYMTSTRIVQAGHLSAMMCMLLGEITNPFQNGLAIAELAQSIPGWCGPDSVCTIIHGVLELAFAILYLLFRVIIGPIACMHMTYNLWTVGKTTPPLCQTKWLLVIWTLLIWAVLLGSIPWIVTCWNTLQQRIILRLGFQTVDDSPTEL